MNYCELCNEYTSLDQCKCKPFTVITQEGDEEVYHAVAPELAAEKYAVDYNEDGDYELMNKSIEIEVDGKKYKVSAEASIDYYVKPIN